MSSETGIQDVRVSIKEIQMSSETGIHDVRVLIVRIAKINSFGTKRNEIRITRILEGPAVGGCKLPINRPWRGLVIINIIIQFYWIY